MHKSYFGISQEPLILSLKKKKRRKKYHLFLFFHLINNISFLFFTKQYFFSYECQLWKILGWTQVFRHANYLIISEKKKKKKVPLILIFPSYQQYFFSLFTKQYFFSYECQLWKILGWTQVFRHANYLIISTKKKCIILFSFYLFSGPMLCSHEFSYIFKT